MGLLSKVFTRKPSASRLPPELRQHGTNLLEHDDPQARIQALDKLAESQHETTIPFITHALSDPDHRVASYAAFAPALHEFKHPALTRALCAAARDKTKPETVRANAVFTLGINHEQTALTTINALRKQKLPNKLYAEVLHAYGELQAAKAQEISEATEPELQARHEAISQHAKQITDWLEQR